MECEVCGAPVERPFEAEIEGGVMKVCQRCARYGTVTRSHSSKVPNRGPPKQSLGGLFRAPENVLECKDDYGGLIRNARENKDMTREDLGRTINEKASVIGRLESGAMMPDTKLARKIEKALGIKILEVQGEEKISSGSSPSADLTIGDLIK